MKVILRTLHADTPGPVYDHRIFTQFAAHLGDGVYGGLWVGKGSKISNTRGFRNDVVGALKQLGVPVVRWPGGCFANEYHWREGIGAPAKRPVKVNTHWGGVTEPNAVVSLAGVTASAVTGQILTAGAMNAHNDFDMPNVVAPAAFTGARIDGMTLSVALPAKSVVMLDLQ